MRLRVLGSNGGVGARRRTTSFLLDDDVLIDAGTGAADLSLEEMVGVRRTFLSHAHLDHVAGLFLLLDSVYSLAPRPMTVHGQAATLEAVSSHLLNNVVWPDFRRIPSPDDPTLVLQPMAPGETLADRGRVFTMVEACHTVPAAGYLVSGPGGGAAFAFSGDTGRCPGFWQALNASARLDLLVVEVSFPDSKAELAIKTGHHHPASLAAELENLVHRPKIGLTHLKPGLEEEIEADCRRVLAGRDVRILSGGEVFTL